MAAENEELIAGYLDREKVKSDTAFLEKELGRVVELFDFANSKRIDLNAAKGIKDTAAATEIGVKANARLGESVKAVNSLINQRFAAEAKLKTSQTDYARETARATAEVAKYNKEMKAQIAVDSAANGSIEKATALRTKLRLEQSKVNQGTEEGAARSQLLISRIDKLDEFIKKNSDSLTKQKINIGNYSGAINILKGSLDDINKKIAANTAAGKQNTAAQQALVKEQRILQQLTQTQAAGFANLRAEYMANTKALQAMTAAGLEGTQAFKDLTKTTGKLGDTISDIKATAKTLGSDTFVFDSLLQGAQTLAGAYGVAQGAMALFGEENEEFQKQMVKLQAIMTVIQGLQSISNAIQKESALVQGALIVKEKALTAVRVIQQFVMKGIISATVQDTVAKGTQAAATGAVTASTRVATVAMIGLRAALIATGVGALVIGLIALVSALSDMGDEIDDVNLSLDVMASRMDRVTAAADAQKNNIANATKIQLEYAKMKGASDKELTDIEIRGLELTATISRNTANAKIADAKRLGAANGFFIKGVLSDASSVQQAINGLATTLAYGVDSAGKELGKKQVENLKAVKDGLEAAKNDFIAAEQGTTDVLVKGLESKAAAAEKARQKQKERDDEARKKREEYAKAEAAAQNEILKLAIEDRKNVNKRILDDEKVGFAQRLEAAAEFARASVELADLEANLVKNDPKKTKGEKDLAERKRVIANRDIKIQAEKDVQAVIDSHFAQNKESADRMMDQFRKDNEARRQAIKDVQDNKNAQEELSLMLQFEADAVGKNIDERRKLEEKLSADLIALKNKQALASLIIDEQELKRKRAILMLFKLSTAEVDKLITENQLAQSKVRIDNTKKEEDEKARIRNEALDRYVEIQGEISSIVSTISAGSDTREKNRIQDDIEKIEERKQAEILAAQASAGTEEEKAARIAIIQATAQAKKEELELRQRKIDQQRAKFEKELGIMQIIVQIGVAIAKQQYYAAALAGAALIKAIATPIPRFFRGKDKHNKYEGLGITNDGGKIEPIFRAATGRIEIPTAINNVTYLGKDDLVYKSVDDMLAKMALPSIPGARPAEKDNGSAEVAKQLKAQTKVLQAIRDKPTLSLSATDGGMQAIWKRQASQVKYIDENTNW